MLVVALCSSFYDPVLDIVGQFLQYLIGSGTFVARSYHMGMYTTSLGLANNVYAIGVVLRFQKKTVMLQVSLLALTSAPQPSKCCFGVTFQVGLWCYIVHACFMLLGACSLVSCTLQSYLRHLTLRPLKLPKSFVQVPILLLVEGVSVE